MIRFPILLFVMLGCTLPSQTLSPYSTIRNHASQRYGNTVDLGEVSEENMAPALEQLRAMVKAGKRALTLRIDSPGGAIFLGMSWIRDVEDLKKANPGTRITCIVDGMAYSMAAVILQSHVCDVRLATSRSTILFHNSSVSGGPGGGAENMRSLAQALEALNTAMALMISERLRMPLEEYKALIEGRDWMMATPEAVHYRVIDGLVSPMEIAPPEAA